MLSQKVTPLICVALVIGACQSFSFAAAADVLSTSDFVRTYAPKYWEAGDSIVTAMFGLAFAVYVVLVNSKDARDWVHEYRYILVALAFVGNSLLGIVLWRLYVHERNLLLLAVSDADFHRQILGAFRIRFGLFAANAIIYLMVIYFVAWRVGRTKIAKML